MRLVTLLDSALQRVVTLACGHHVRIMQLHSFDDVQEELARLCAPLIFVDPQWLSEDSFDRFLADAQRSLVPASSDSATAVLAQLRQWIADYNHFAPHASLGLRSPVEYRREQETAPE